MVDGYEPLHQQEPELDLDLDLENEDGGDSEDTASHIQAALDTRAKWAFFLSLGLASYIYSLDGSTTSAYLTFATSSFGKHRLIASIQVVQSIIIAVGKPVIAKIADVSSRGTAYLFVLIFYVLGYITIASAQNVGMIACGIIIYSVGYTGLQLLTQIVIADITTLKWRGLVSSLTTAPFLLNAFVGANISTAVIKSIGWRWGYGMFAILVPLALAPLIAVLLRAEALISHTRRRSSFSHHRRSLSLSISVSASMSASIPLPSPTDDRTPLARPSSRHRPSSYTSSESSSGRVAVTSRVERWKRRAVEGAEALDAVGLVLLGSSLALVLVPLTVSSRNANVGMGIGFWGNASLVLGLVMTGLFGYWDFNIASKPVVAKRFLTNRSVIAAGLIGAFDFASYFLTSVYLYSFVLVVKPWTLIQSTYFSQVQTVALTFFGILAGLGMRYLHRYKRVLLVGLCIRLVGVVLMLSSRGAHASSLALVFTQILQGVGGGLAAVTVQVGAQASVPHGDVGMVTALVLLATELGGAFGTAIAGSIWSSMMPAQLEKHLPFLSAERRAELFGSILLAREEPRGDPTREGVILAYGEVMRVMILWATAFSVLPILVAFFMPDWYLGDQQNAAETVGLGGQCGGDDERGGN